MRGEGRERNIMLRYVIVSSIFLGLGLVTPKQGIAQGFSKEGTEWQRSFLNQYCIACHNDTTLTANFTLQTIALDQVGHNLNEIGVWEKVVLKLRAREMPPPEMPRPDAQAYDRLAAWLETSLDDAAAVNPNPGQPVIRRLNRAEYTNAVRDLLALEIDGREYLPADDSGYGFDNIGDVLTLSPSLLERYMIAAAKVSQLAVGDPDILPAVQTYEMRPTYIQSGRTTGQQPFGTRGGNTISHYFPLDGEYHIKIRLARTHANQIIGLFEPHDIEVRFDRKRIAEYTVGGDGIINPWAAVMYASEYEQTADDHLELRLKDIKAGTHSITVAFPEKRRMPEGILEPALSSASYEFAGDRDMPMALGSIEVYGPYNAARPADTPSRNSLFSCGATETSAGNRACASQILMELARKAYRRPVTDDDLATLMRFYASGYEVGGFDRGIQRALRAILVDPEFLFRIESTPSDADPNSVHQISDIELASRLSFFLWSSVPDDQLLTLAEQNRLSEASILRAEVIRMLADQKSFALIENFASRVTKNNGFIVAYSNAELDIFRRLPGAAANPNFSGICYINLLSAAKHWIRRYKSSEFESLPPFRRNVPSFQSKRMRYSLASVMRLTDLNAPADYAPGRTTSRFNTVAAALQKRRHDFSSLTNVQKAKMTKVLKHNLFDVKAMPVLFEKIWETDPNCFKKAVFHV